MLSTSNINTARLTFAGHGGHSGVEGKTVQVFVQQS